MPAGLACSFTNESAIGFNQVPEPDQDLPMQVPLVHQSAVIKLQSRITGPGRPGPTEHFMRASFFIPKASAIIKLQNKITGPGPTEHSMRASLFIPKAKSGHPLSNPPGDQINIHFNTEPLTAQAVWGKRPIQYSIQS